MILFSFSSIWQNGHSKEIYACIKKKEKKKKKKKQQLLTKQYCPMIAVKIFFTQVYKVLWHFKNICYCVLVRPRKKNMCVSGFIPRKNRVGRSDLIYIFS